MKLSKETLMRIIQEELEQETKRSLSNPKFDLEDGIEKLVMNYLGRGFDLDSEEQNLISEFVKAISALTNTGIEEATAAEEKERLAKIMANFSDEENAAEIERQNAENARPAVGMTGKEEPMSPSERHRKYLLRKHSKAGKKR